MANVNVLTVDDLMMLHQKVDIIDQKLDFLASKKTDNEKAKMIGAQEVIERLGLSLGTWRKREKELTKAGILHPNRIGRLIKYNSREIDRIVEDNLIHKYQHKPRY